MVIMVGAMKRRSGHRACLRLSAIIYSSHLQHLPGERGGKLTGERFVDAAKKSVCDAARLDARGRQP
jgi:hypothetical protein